MDTEKNIKEKVTVLDILSGATALICFGVYLTTRFKYGGSLNQYTEKLFTDYPILAPSFLSVTFLLILLANIQALRRGEPFTLRRFMHIIVSACFAVSLLFGLIYRFAK